MEHIGHFPISMETCMDNRLTLTTEKTQQKPFQGKAYEQCCSTHSISPHSQKNTVLSHAEFPPSIESMPSFPGKQFLQGKEKFTLPDIENMPFFLGNQFLQGKKKSTLGTKLKPFMDTLDTDQKSSTSSKVIHKKGRIIAAAMIGITLRTITTPILMSVHPQDTISKKLDRLRKITAQGNQLTRLSRCTNTGLPCDKKSLPTNLHKLWNHRETLSIESRITVMMDIIISTVHVITTHCLMSEHFSDSISNRLAQLGKNTLQKKHITRLKDHNNIDQLCDRENLLTDLPESWPYNEPLHNKSGLINYGDKIITVMYQYIQKEVYILSRPSKLQPILPDCGTPPLQQMADCSIASPLQLITQHTPREKDLPQLPSTLGAQEMYEIRQELIRRQQNKPEKNYIKLTPGTPVWVQHRQNTSWEPATVMSQCTTNSYWIMQENGTDQTKVYRRTRTMLKIRCTPTEVEQTGYRKSTIDSQSTESEKAEFHTSAIPNTTRNYVEHNSAENISQDLVQLTVTTPDTASFDFESEEREEIADVPAPALTPAPGLETIEEQSTRTPGSRKSTRKNFGKPASSFSDFYMYLTIKTLAHLD